MQPPRSLLVLSISVAATLAVAAAEPARAAAPALIDPPLAYRIEVTFDEGLRDYRGELELRWQHPLVEPLTEIPLHLYLNAFNHLDTTWMRGASAIKSRDLRAHAERFEDPWGHIEVTAVEQSGVGACTLTYMQPDDGNPLDRTLARVALKQSVPPGEALVLRIAFTGRMPILLARTGNRGDYLHGAQWYPKLGVYEPARGSEPGHWAARQFHGPTEFYAPFANYDVTLAVPAGLTVFATGGAPVPTPDGRARYVQRSVHDFAFVVGRGLAHETHAFTPPGGRAIDVTYVVPGGFTHHIARMRRAAETTLELLATRVAAYPFAALTIVQPPWFAQRSAGMEYPTLVTGVPSDPLLDIVGARTALMLEGTLAHEVIHNTFQGFVASDEQQQAFLDEGFTSYWTSEVMRELERKSGSQLFGFPYLEAENRRSQLGSRARDLDEAIIQRPASLFSQGTHRLQIYTRPSLTLATAAARHGNEALDKVFAVYVARHAFTHPTADDFLAVAREVGPPPLADFLDEAFTATGLPDYEIVEAKTSAWRSPWGDVPTASGLQRVTLAGEEAATDEEVGLDPNAKENDGAVRVRIDEPSYLEAGAVVPGRVRVVALTPMREPTTHPDPPKDSEERPRYYASEVRVHGPRWRHLAVPVRFTFADGVVVSDAWDGRAAWRAYHFVRPARLREVRIDPDDTVRLDPTRRNNGWLAEPDDRWSSELASFLVQLAQWAALTAGGFL